MSVDLDDMDRHLNVWLKNPVDLSLYVKEMFTREKGDGRDRFKETKVTAIKRIMQVHDITLVDLL